MELHRNVKIRMVIAFLNMGGQCLIFPFLAIYFAKYYGAALAGALFFLPVFASMVASLSGGYYADKFGRKNIIVFGSVLQLLSALLLTAGNVPGHVIPIFAFLSLLFLNISVGLQFPPLEALVIDSTSFEQRKKVYGILYWLNNFAMAAGTLLGAFFHDTHFFQLTIIMSSINLSMFVLLAFFLTETKSVLPENKTNLTSPLKNIWGSYKLVFQNFTFLKYMIAGILTLGLEKQLGKYISVRLQGEFQPVHVFSSTIDGVKLFGILMTENSVLAVVFTLLITGMIARRKMSDKRQISIGIFLFASGFVVLAVSNSIWVLAGFMFILTIGEIMMSPVKQMLLSEIAEGSDRSKYLAANMLNSRGAAMLGAIGLSAASFMSSFGMAVIYGLMGATAIFFFRSIYKERRNFQRQKTPLKQFVK
ncbi:MAG TPA: MFS transporter [Bacillales bacterium]|nr:MFS transporter [Bacillales bacterium]